MGQHGLDKSVVMQDAPTIPVKEESVGDMEGRKLDNYAITKNAPTSPSIEEFAVGTEKSAVIMKDALIPMPKREDFAICIGRRTVFQTM